MLGRQGRRVERWQRSSCWQRGMMGEDEGKYLETSVPTDKGLFIDVKVGGPNWNIELGRRDSSIANASASSDLPGPAMDVEQLIKKFQVKNSSEQDLVVLSELLHIHGWPWKVAGGTGIGN
uniref:peroxidase n=1 Tax=Fagus sylvatica TaxID=28930 RepID=A0A2N9HD56_FAGSY